MDIIIKGTNSIDEYKKTRRTLEERANSCYTVHKAACENWEHGNPVKVWRDEYSILCIAYDDGIWFHYGFKPTGLEWW